ncbi:MAG: PD40 domain-containing protein [Candidatus Aminicenantes bacterium]|nr:PD40 domain-containing protein [Candidatus Aminicenantes bacterium]
MRKMLFLLALSALMLYSDVLRFPALSPDGRNLAFSYQGDIWVYSLKNKTLKHLTDHEAFEGWPVFSPDGKFIAFSSKRYGNFDVFVIPVEGGIPKRLTFHTSDDIVNSWTPDGKFIVFHSSRENQVSLYKISINGGTPDRIFPGFWAIPNFGKISPDGKRIIFNNSWESFRFWWRKGYKGSFNSDIILYNLETKKFKQLTNYEGNDMYQNWAPDGRSIYFVSDRDFNTQNIFKLDLNSGKTTRLTSFKKGALRWLTSAYSVDVLAFEHAHRLWILDLRENKPKPVRLKIRADLKENLEKWVTLKNVEQFSVSPDRKKLAIVSRGNIFVCDTDGKYLERVTDNPWRESQPVWDKDSKHIFFVSDKMGNSDIFRIDASSPKKWEKIATTPEEERMPAISPDGKYLAYIRGKKDLVVYNIQTGNSKTIYKGQLAGLWGGSFSWSPDSKWIVVGDSFYWEPDIVTVNVETGEKIRLTHNTLAETSYNWAPDGKFIVYTANYTGHSFPDRTGQFDIYLLPLLKGPQKFREDFYEKLFKTEEKKEKKKPKITVKIEPEDIEKRKIQLTNTIQNESSPLFSEDGKKIIFLSRNNNKSELWLIELNEFNKVKKRKMLYSSSSMSNLRWLNKSTVAFITSGKIMKLQIGGRSPSPVNFFYKEKINRKAEFQQMFGEIWNTLWNYYYDPNFHGIDWNKVKAKYSRLVKDCYTDDEFYMLMNEMFGELNSSHVGIYPPFTERNETTAALGLELEKEKGSGFFKIKRIIKHGPVYKTGKKVEGYYLIGIDDKRVSVRENLPALLANKAGKRVKLTVNKIPSEKNAETFFVKPIPYSQKLTLRYNEWEEINRERVHRWSNDKIGYVHMKNMGWSELLRFYQELEKETLGRKALIFDIRFNTGGNVHDQVLNTLIKKVYAKWQVRDFKFTYQPSYAVRPKPMVLLINEFSLSDAEMTANGFKELKLGKIIGNTTYGWLIFTTGKSLINGAYFRIPFWGCFTLSGADLEKIGGVKPDIKVINTFEDRVKGRDSQLKKAVEILMKEIK